MTTHLANSAATSVAASKKAGSALATATGPGGAAKGNAGDYSAEKDTKKLVFL